MYKIFNLWNSDRLAILGGLQLLCVFFILIFMERSQPSVHAAGGVTTFRYGWLDLAPAFLGLVVILALAVYLLWWLVRDRPLRRRVIPWLILTVSLLFLNALALGVVVTSLDEVQLRPESVSIGPGNAVLRFDEIAALDDHVVETIVPQNVGVLVRIGRRIANLLRAHRGEPPLPPPTRIETERTLLVTMKDGPVRPYDIDGFLTFALPSILDAARAKGVAVKTSLVRR